MKKKAYRRFEELTQQATAPMLSEDGRPGMGSSAEALAIRLSPETRRALEDRAAGGNHTPSEVVEAALRRYLDLT